MTSTDVNRQQHEHWAGREGDHWAGYADRHDHMLAPFAAAVAAAANVKQGERVLDIGCGCGATTITAAAAAGPTGEAMGVDLSPQMLEVARTRAKQAGVAGQARFQVADAQVADLGAASWDVACSRFGVMFFEDPGAAFANIAGSLRAGGRLVICCWQPLAANDWMLVPGIAAAAHVALPEGLDGEQPGPFSLGDPDRLRGILADAGLGSVAIEGFETSILIAGGGSLDQTMDYLITSGSGRALLDGAPEPARRAAIDAVRAAVEPFHDGEGVRLGAAAWIVTAHKPNI